MQPVALKKCLPDSSQKITCPTFYLRPEIYKGVISVSFACTKETDLKKIIVIALSEMTKNKTDSCMETLVFNLEPAFFIVYQQLQVVLPLWLAVVPDFKYSL